jgi:hypothetical protein
MMVSKLPTVHLFKLETIDQVTLFTLVELHRWSRIIVEWWYSVNVGGVEIWQYEWVFLCCHQRPLW